MKPLTIIIITVAWINLPAQKKVEDFGYIHHQLEFQSDTVDFVVKSKQGDELKKKPILIWIQGSLAKPLIKYNEDGNHYPPFSFSEHIFTDQFHLVCIGKPSVPLVIKKSRLDANGEFRDEKTNLPPQAYINKANLTYYTERNSRVVDYLIKQTWVDTNKIVVAGHSEGASIAVKMAATDKRITHLIYSGGTPYFSRILSIISQDRRIETAEESWIKRDYEYWRQVNENPFDTSREHGWNAYKGTSTFSPKLNNDFKRLTIPVLVSYGTKDPCSPFNDLLRVEMIYENKTNIDFKYYLNREHNYFGVLENGTIDNNDFGWDLVGKDWLNWIKIKE